jgi:uncharacterized cupin superfamily protein
VKAGREEMDMPRIFRRDERPMVKREARVAEFSWHTTPRLAALAGSKRLQFDLRSLDPGAFSFPYHFHRASEELFLVLEGEATLRTPDGFEQLGPGDLVFFEEGPTSAHQLHNHGESTCVYLDIRTVDGVDVTEYPDSGKLAILPSLEVFRGDSKVDYFDGEEDVASRWPAEIMKRAR